MRNPDQYDPNFLSDLERSKPSQAAVFVHLFFDGWDVEAHPPVPRPRVEDRHRYADEFDIRYRKPFTQFWRTVEVHQLRKRAFTCLQDFPFRTAILDPEYKVRRSPKDEYWIVDQHCRHAAIFLRETTESKWFAEERMNNYRTPPRLETNVYCPKELAIMVRLSHVIFPVNEADDRIKEISDAEVGEQIEIQNRDTQAIDYVDDPWERSYYPTED